MIRNKLRVFALVNVCKTLGASLRDGDLGLGMSLINSTKVKMLLLHNDTVSSHNLFCVK